MIAFAAPAGTASIAIPGGEFDPDTGILGLPDALATALGAALVALGFVNLGSSTMSYARVVTGQFNAAGPSDSIIGIGNINVSVWAVDPASPVTSTFALERSFDGTQWLPVTALAEAIELDGAFSTTFPEAEAGVLYRLRCTAFSGGIANYRISRP